MPDAVPRVFIAGYYGFGNAGDEAILAAMIAGLRALRPDLGITVASGDPPATERDHGVLAVDRDDLPAVAAAMGESGLVILGGGGLFQDYWDVPLETVFTPRSGGLPFYAGFALLAALLGRPCMVYGVGVGPLRTETGQRLTRAVFGLCQGATVRDPESLALLGELGSDLAGIEAAADPAFGLAPAAAGTLESLIAGLGLAPGERPVGVALRPWSFVADPAAWEAEVARGLDGFLSDRGDRLLLLSFQADEDLPVHRRVRALLAAPERALLAERRLAPAELAGLVGRCGRFLAMRYHAALFALAAGVPTAALAYDPKVRSLLAAAGSDDLALAPEDWNAGSVTAALRDARPPATGFGEEMRQRAARSARKAVEILEQGLPVPAEAQRFLRALAAEKVVSGFRTARNDALLREQIASLEARLREITAEREALREQRGLILAERNDVERRLTAVERTLAYRIVSRFWGLVRRTFPEGSRRRKLYRLGRRIVGRLLGSPPEAAWAQGMGGAPATPNGEAHDPRADLLRFEEQVRDSGADRVVALFSATQLLESEGQRPTQLALACARRGIPVVFVYWRWWDNEWCPQDRLAEGILQIPIDVVTRRPEMLIQAFGGLERIALFEFPHPGFFETVSAASSAGWLTVYDALDDWEEFHRVGQAVWYGEPFERHLINACDAVFAINGVLAGRIRDLGGESAEIVGNGFKPGLETVREPRPLERGEVTVGYFGYLAGAWFDWELIAAAARLRPSWRFYLIGYGGSPEGIALPETVQLLGKQPQTDLAAYAANWDVAVIPFKPDRLAAGADPIKTYEYLAMGLPVVTAGVYPPDGGEGLVTRAEGVEDFVREIGKAVQRQDPEEMAARRAFAAACTWDHRLGALLDSLAEGRQRVAEKRALFGGRP